MTKIEGTAEFGDEVYRYRYLLTRTWDDSLPKAAFILLNPSTADAEKNDSTVECCIKYAQQWKADKSGGIIILNLFAFTTSDPEELAAFGYPIGPQNDHQFRVLGAAFRDGLVNHIVVGWGGNRPKERICKVIQLLGDVKIECLMKNADGSPRHPHARQYQVPYGQKLESWDITDMR
ncbi:DUF1643 domain-containing protein [Bifidobacterium sp. ESL0682]|uniref:DUF1643 domain-containing protein n=1 Tax=Bifidobacterium sp. ESL0682 TaxID=2983212 RepID=UPI0023FA06F1|nr:DUF1643 domain-containing protein [Bifidobacterium sp. ESL0682]WEV41989.1 DUF1643 domain-containing protein [Bifidobacterium sp. ESL0682]